jgi:hypothetical protein
MPMETRGFLNHILRSIATEREIEGVKLRAFRLTFAPQVHNIGPVTLAQRQWIVGFESSLLVYGAP